MNPDNKEDLWLVDQLNKCRCCFEKFDQFEKQVKITEIIQQQFLELTQIELKSSSIYSNNVCMKCTNKLQSISNFRLNLISKQQQLYEFVITSQYKTQDVVKFELVNIKIETQSSDELDNIFKFETQYEEIENTEVPVISEAAYTNKDYQSPRKRCSLRQLKALKPKIEIKVQKKLLTKIKLKVKTKVQPKEQKKSQTKVQSRKALIKVNCPQCGIQVHSSAYLKLHIRIVHLKEKRFFCDHCSYAAMNKDGIKSHLPTHLRKKIQSQLMSNKIPKKAICPHCGIILNRNCFLRRHIERVHLKLKNYFCDTCNFGTRDKPDIVRHVKIHIPTEFREKFSCDQCDHVSFSLSLLKTHKKLEHSIEATKYECYCGKVYPQVGQLNQHKKYSHGNYEAIIKHVCTICKKGLQTPYALKIHMAVHSKPHIPCEVCGKMFPNLTRLTQHSIIHKDPQFSCDFEGCTKKFFVSNVFEAHKKTHIGQRDFACHLCDKKYFASNHLHRHVLHFHKQLKISCELPGCSSKFARKETYRNHVLSHHKDLSEVKKKSLFKKIREMKQV